MSDRIRSLKIGISSYTDNELVLDINGNTNITGVVTATKFSGVRLGDLSDIDQASYAGISTDYLMVYDPTISAFKFVDPKSYFGINDDFNPSVHIDDYGDNFGTG